VAAGEPVGTPEADVEAEAANAGWDEGTPAVAGASATSARSEAGSSARARGLQAPAWSTIAALGLGVLLIAPTVLASPARFAQVDHRRVVEAQTWTDHVMDTLDPGAVLVSWWSFSTPLWYEQLVDGRRPDVAIIDDRTRLDENLGEITDVIDANLGKRPVYVIRLDPREVALLASRYELEYIDGFDATMLTRVVGPKVAS